MKLDSYEYKGKWWTACHQCECKRDCEIGRNISEENVLNRGCWGGEPTYEAKNEFEQRKVQKCESDF